MTHKLDAMLLAARRLDAAHDALLKSPSPEAKAELIQAETDYARALDALHSASLDTECSR